MLFHVTMTHKPDECPTDFPPDKQRKFFATAEKTLTTANKQGINILYFVSGVGHVMYALVEADGFNSLNGFFSNMQIKQELQIEPVGNIKDVISAFKKQPGKKK